MKKLDTPRGSGARSMTALSPSSLSVSYGSPTSNFSGDGPDWMGPLTPMLPLAEETAGRAFDYRPGYNLLTQPRADEPITFPMLRALADSFDPLRLMIEKRKSQLCRVPWVIRIKNEHGKRPTKGEPSASVRNTIRELTDFVKAPMFGMPFRQWRRVVLEDHYVVDAAALFCLRGRGGELLELQPVDGGLIKRVIDSQGRAPRPVPYDGRTPFDWNGLQITPENFRTQGFKYVNGYALPPSYQQLLHGLPASDLTTHDLLYRVMNLRSDRLYGVSPVEQIMMTVNIAMRRTASQLEYYQSGNMPEALFSLPETWSPDQISRYQDYFDNLFVGNLANRRQLKFIAGGGKSSFIPIREPPLKNEFDEWLTRIVCFAFSYPPTPFLNLSNRSVSEQHDKTGEEEGLQDTKIFISDLINDVITEEFVPDGSIEFAWVEEDEVDQEKQSEILARYVEDGVMSINEARERLGLEPSSDKGANSLQVKTMAGYQPIKTPTTIAKDKNNDDV
jgi:hypothetical protein